MPDSTDPTFYRTPDHGGITADARLLPHGEDFRGLPVHQTRLQGGDASSDSYCHTG